MNSRGWGWTPSEIRLVQLAEWLAEAAAEAPSLYHEVEPFYRARTDQRENDFGVANADLKRLEDQGLIDTANGLGGIEGLAAMIAPAGRDLIEELQAGRADKARRRIACRDAMVAWLYSVDAITTRNQPVRHEMLSDTRYGMWLAKPFEDTDLAEASAWLHEQRLASGVTSWGDPGLVRLSLTSDGVSCAELFESNTIRYLEGKKVQRHVSQTVNVGGNNSGSIQMAGDNAHQVQNTGGSAERLRELINSLADQVSQIAPDANVLAAEHNAALAAAEDGAVDESAIRKFGSWVLSVVSDAVSKGASAALVASASAEVTHLLQEAARIAGQLT